MLTLKPWRVKLFLGYGGDWMKNIFFKVEDELHKDIKIKATEEGKSIKEFILDLIKQELKK